VKFDVLNRRTTHSPQNRLIVMDGIHDEIDVDVLINTVKALFLLVLLFDLRIAVRFKRKLISEMLIQ